MLVYRGKFNHFLRAQDEAITLFLASGPRSGVPFIVCWAWTQTPDKEPDKVLYSGVIQETLDESGSKGIRAIHHDIFRTQLDFSKDLNTLSFQFSDDLGTDPTQSRLKRDNTPSFDKLGDVYDYLHVGFISDVASTDRNDIVIALTKNAAEDTPVFAAWRLDNSSTTPTSPVAMVDSLIDTVECLSGKSGSAFEFNHRDFRFHCCLGESGKSTLAITTSTSSQPMKTARMSLAGYSASETTTIVNDTCETVRYRINDSSKHVVEEVAMGILSLMPTFGIDKLSKIPSAVHKATKIAEWISAGLTMKSMWHSVIQDSSSIRGILFPKDQVERTTTSSNIRNANDVVIERYSIETSTNSIVVDTYEYSRAQTETFYLKDIIVDGEPPSGWTKSTEKWSLFQSKDCKPDRAIQIPNFGVKVGECNIETFNQSPHGAFYCICSDELKARMFPYMTTANVDNHETLGIYDESKCSYYIQSKDGSRHGSRVMSLPTKKHIPVVVLEQTRLRKRGTLEPVELGTAEERQDVDHTVLTKIEDESARGRSYWGVSVEQDRVIRGYPEVPPDYRDKKWVLQKAKKSLCRTYFVGNHWVPVY